MCIRDRYLITTALLTAVAAWGLNIVSGFAGQISLAHGAFIGIGTYVSAVLGGVGSSYIRGYELDMLIWLPLAGIVPAIIGLISSCKSSISISVFFDSRYCGIFSIGPGLKSAIRAIRSSKLFG